jgi:hypothetical protein
MHNASPSFQLCSLLSFQRFRVLKLGVQRPNGPVYFNWLPLLGFLVLDSLVLSLLVLSFLLSLVGIQLHTMRMRVLSSYLNTNTSSRHYLSSLQSDNMTILKYLHSGKIALVELATLNSIFRSQRKDGHAFGMEGHVRHVERQSVSDKTAITKVLERFYPTLLNRI